MAAYTPNKSTTQTLTANTVDTVTLQYGFAGVEIVNNGPDTISVTKNNIDPGVLADDTYTVRGNDSLVLSVTTTPRSPALAVTPPIKLKSASGVQYTVTGVN